MSALTAEIDPQREPTEMARHLILPKQSLKDIRSLLRLEEDRLRELIALFGTAESIAPSNPDFLQKVSEQLRLDSDTAASVVLVAQFLLTVVEEGHPANEILDDVRYFVGQHAVEEKGLVQTLDTKRELLLALLTPKPERTRALKLRYLQNVHPLADSFRTICELRPLFDKTGQGEDIVGYVPAVLLEVMQHDSEGNETQVVLSLSPDGLRELSKVLKRAEEKLAAIRRRFGDQLLGDDAQE